MIGETLRRLRQQQGLTQAEVAAKFQPKPITSVVLSKWEHDKAVPTLPTLRQLARIYGVTLDELTVEAPAPVPAANLARAAG